MVLCFSFARFAPASFRIIWGELVFIPTGRLSLSPSLPFLLRLSKLALFLSRRATNFFFLLLDIRYLPTYNNRGNSHSLPILERVTTKNPSTPRSPRLQHRHRRNHKPDISSSLIQQVGPPHIIEPGWAVPFLATCRPTIFLSGKDQHLDLACFISPSQLCFHAVAHPSELRCLSSEDRVSISRPPPVFPLQQALPTSGPTANRRTQSIVFWRPIPSSKARARHYQSTQQTPLSPPQRPHCLPSPRSHPALPTQTNLFDIQPELQTLILPDISKQITMPAPKFLLALAAIGAGVASGLSSHLQFPSSSAQL